MINRKCPRCGSTQVRLSSERSKHGCFWFILYGWIYLVWVVIKWMIGLTVLVLLDWWMAIIKACMDKGYVWKCARWFSGTKKVYYCYSCGYNFRG